MIVSQPQATVEHRIRWLIRRDMREILEIEKRSFDHPWTEEEFLCCLRQRNCIGMVYESSRYDIHGYMIYELHKDRLKILNLAVAPEVRRTGIGRAMVTRLIDKLSQQRRTSIECEVSERNLPAQLFLQAAGFRAEEILRTHYDLWLDGAYLFRFTIPEAMDHAGRIGW